MGVLAVNAQPPALLIAAEGSKPVRTTTLSQQLFPSS
jgi:hypothetical protein